MLLVFDVGVYVLKSSRNGRTSKIGESVWCVSTSHKIMIDSFGERIMPCLIVWKVEVIMAEICG